MYVLYQCLELTLTLHQTHNTMKFPSPVSIDWLAELISAKVNGDTSKQAIGINEIHRVETGDVCFVDHPKYYDKCLNSDASFIIINTLEVNIPEGKAILVVADPFEAYLKIVRHFRPFSVADKMISPTAVVGKTSVLMPGVFIGHHVCVGEGCVIHANVTIRDYTQVGNNVVIQSGTVVGSDAFYYNTKKNREVWYKRMESCGHVVIEDDVEIGAGCTIDRGVSSDSIIGKGTKMDNMIHIGHDTVTGKNCLIAAQVGIAGVVTLEDGVILWGQVGVSKTLTIGSNAVIYAQSGVGGDLEGGRSYFGSPVQDAKVKTKELVWVKRIPELWEKVMGK